MKIDVNIFKNIIPYIDKEDVLVFFRKRDNTIFTSWYYNITTNKWCEWKSEFVQTEIDSEGFNDSLSSLNYVFEYDNSFFTEQHEGGCSKQVDIELYVRIISKKEWCKIMRTENFNYFNERSKDKNSNISKILDFFLRNVGKTFFFGVNDNLGILVNIAISDGDVYYVFIDKDKKIHLDSCVGKPYPINDKRDELYISDFDIKDALNNAFDEYSTDALYTEYNIIFFN